MNTLSTDALGKGILRELETLEALLSDLPHTAWSHRTPFWGLPVRDVAAHVAGVITDVVRGATDGLASPLAVKRQLAERDTRSHDEIIDELREGRLAAASVISALDEQAWASPAPSFNGTLAHAVEALWEDFWLHGDDIRCSVSLPIEQGAGLRNAALHVCRQLEGRGWGRLWSSSKALMPW